MPTNRPSGPILNYSQMANSLMRGAGNALLAPARGYMQQAPQAPNSLGLLGQIHNAIDPVQAFGGYGGLLAMALPPGGVGMKPMRGYHHTSADFEKFSPAASRDRQGAVYFSPHPNKGFNNMHQFWADLRAGKAYDTRGNPISKQLVEMFESGKLSEQQSLAVRARIDEAAKAGNVSGSKIIPADIDMKNPFVFKGKTKSDITLLSQQKVKELTEKGYDGAISYNSDGSIFEIAAFKPGSVKSATTGKTMLGLGGAGVAAGLFGRDE
jgi:hypothetical protein